MRLLYKCQPNARVETSLSCLCHHYEQHKVVNEILKQIFAHCRRILI